MLSKNGVYSKIYNYLKYIRDFSTIDQIDKKIQETGIVLDFTYFLSIEAINEAYDNWRKYK